MSKSNFQKQVLALNRIVIGDVGSGKTMVAFFVAVSFLKGLKNESGQVVMLAPTEVLAFQHYQNFLNFQKNANFNQKSDLSFIQPVFLTSKQYFFGEEKFTKAKFKKKLDNFKEENLDHKIFWLGTHALLFNESVKADFVLVDEQHRFGVRQRQSLSQGSTLQSSSQGEKSQNPNSTSGGETCSSTDQPSTRAHFVSFSATPIPRTLALTIYNSLKPHFLEVLSSRNSIQTSISVLEEFDTSIISKIQHHIDKGKKVYVICPRVEDKEKGDEELWSVDKTVEQLESFFPQKVMKVHGKMAEKKAVLDNFKNHDEKQILVATTVVEVGVDVSEATLVIVINAERFGLAALHQIRGRVGRNSYDFNECVLATYKKYSRSRRLRILCESGDGFVIAEKDLEIRGGGDLVGSQQSGFDNEIESLMGLQPELYEEIGALVNSLDFKNLEGLERLEKYLEKEEKLAWQE